MTRVHSTPFLEICPCFEKEGSQSHSETLSRTHPLLGIVGNGEEKHRGLVYHARESSIPRGRVRGGLVLSGRTQIHEKGENLKAELAVYKACEDIVVLVGKSEKPGTLSPPSSGTRSPKRAQVIGESGSYSSEEHPYVLMHGI